MAEAKVTLLLELKNRISAALGGATSEVNKNTATMKSKLLGLKVAFKQSISEMAGQCPMLGTAFQILTNPIGATIAAIAGLGAGLKKLSDYGKACETDYQMQAVAETKLTTVMRQRMAATNEQIASVVQLASAQQKLGVIGDEVQLSGAQQMGTFVNNTESIKTLIPAMNNLLAQQKGLNATSEDAVGIGNLMGKAMQGQTSALTRVGITFDAAQEKVMKYGTEQQRAAMLATIIKNNVGDMNKALADTPEGKMKQAAENAGELRERIGSLSIAFRASMMPVKAEMLSFKTLVIEFVEQHRSQIVNLIHTASSLIGGAIHMVVTGLGHLSNAISFIWGWKDAIVAVGAAYAVLNAGIIYNSVVTALAAAKTQIMAGMQWLLNIAMTANPIGIIIVAIGALIGIIVHLCRQYSGWVTVWNAVKTTLVNSFKQYVATWKFGFESLWIGVQIFWEKLKGFGEYVSQLFSNIGKAIKAALSGDFGQAKDLLKANITTEADVKVKQLETEQGNLSRRYADDSVRRMREIASAWHNVSLKKKVEQSANNLHTSNAASFGGASMTGEGSDTASGNGNPGDKSKDVTSGVTGAAKQVRNLTVNIDSFVKGGINTSTTELSHMDGKDIEDWFNQTIMRVIRNLEVSY